MDLSKDLTLDTAPIDSYEDPALQAAYDTIFDSSPLTPLSSKPSSRASSPDPSPQATAIMPPLEVSTLGCDNQRPGPMPLSATTGARKSVVTTALHSHASNHKRHGSAIESQHPASIKAAGTPSAADAPSEHERKRGPASKRQLEELDGLDASSSKQLRHVDTQPIPHADGRPARATQLSNKKARKCKSNHEHRRLK